MLKFISGFKNGIFFTVTASVILLNLFFSKNVSATTINFENLDIGEQLYDQYSAEGIYFRDQLSLFGNSPGVIASFGFASSKALRPNIYDSSMYILFDNPAASFNFCKFEESEKSDVLCTVFLEFYKYDGSSYQPIGSFSNSVKDEWVPLSFISDEKISAVSIYGTLPYYADNIQFETIPCTVPEPSTMLLLSSVMMGLVGMGLRRKVIQGS